MLTTEQFNRLKKGDRVYICDNLYSVMKYNWDHNMTLTQNKYGVVVSTNSEEALIEFDFLKEKSRDKFFYYRDCLSIQPNPLYMYKPRKKINN